MKEYNREHLIDFAEWLSNGQAVDAFVVEDVVDAFLAHEAEKKKNCIHENKTLDYKLIGEGVYRRTHSSTVCKDCGATLAIW